MIRLGMTYLLQYKKSFISYIILSFLLGIISLILPLITGSIINNLTELKSIKVLMNLCLLFSIISFIRIIIQFISQKLYIFTQTNAGFQLNLDVIEHVKKVSLNFVNSQETSYLNQRINNDSNSIIIFLISLFNNFVINAVSMLFSLYLLYKINIIIGLMLSLLLLIYFCMYITFKKKLFSMSLLFKESQSRFFSALNEQLTNVKFVKEHSVYEFFSNKLKTAFYSFLKKITKSQLFFYFYNSLDSIISLCAQISVYIIGGILVIKGVLDLGTFTIVISYFQMLLTAIKYFSSLGTTYQDTIVSYKRIINIFNYKEQGNGDVKIDKINSINLNNVYFGYNDKNIIKNFSYQFKKGKVYGIVGNNGAGKSTLIELILGLYIDEYKGKILYNHINIDKIDMIDLRLRKISVLEQEPMLINTSIGKNIILTKYHSRAKCAQVIKQLNFSDFFLNLPNGLNTNINEKSNNISGGEKQKIALVRQLCKSSDLIIFDEPTSALDIESKKNLIEYLTSIKKDKIILMIAHDEKLKTYYDKVINL